MKHRWYWVVAVAGFLAGSLVWEMRADYAPPRPRALPELGVSQAEQRGFLIIVKPAAGQCDVVAAAGQHVATFKCQATGGRW